MLAVLKLAGSSYLPPFLELQTAVQREAGAAQDNVRVLACLDGPCQQLRAAPPAAIPGLLPHLLHCIRLVWSLSSYYAAPERVAGLLRRLSSEVIARCCAALAAADVFDGDVAAPLQMLQQSMDAGARRSCLGRRLPDLLQVLHSCRCSRMHACMATQLTRACTVARPRRCRVAHVLRAHRRRRGAPRRQALGV